MEYQDITYEVHDSIATITLNRPERMNSFSEELLASWSAAITRTPPRTRSVRVVVVTGAGRGFCAGADVRARAEENAILASDENWTPAMRRNSIRYSVQRVPQALQYLDKPYIAAINGAAVGAGMDMCSMADIRIASEQARFGMAYVNVGLIPGDGGAWLLPRLVGLQKALELIWSGELFSAQEALDIGYVSRVVPHESLLDEVYAYAAKLSSGPPIAMQMAKRLVYRGLSTPFTEALEAAQSAMTDRPDLGRRGGGPEGLLREAQAGLQGPLAEPPSPAGRIPPVPSSRWRRPLRNSRFEGGPAPSPLAGETPQGANWSSGELLAVVPMRPGGGLVVAGAGPEAAVEVADEAVGERAQRLVVKVARGSPPLVEVVAAGTGLQRAQRPAGPRRRRAAGCGRSARFTVRLRPDATVSGEVPA